MKFRHEIKHEINYADFYVLKSRLSAIMKSDDHSISGSYQIRSLYFDTPSDTALREKIDGVNNREKFRLRYYNLDPGLIHLEKKSKQNGLCHKETVTVTVDEVEKLLAGELDWMKGHPQPLVRELYVKMKNTGLKPKTVVDYIRVPFVYPAGNVRVTLDHRIRTGMYHTDFLNPEMVTVPASDAVILEVKWDEFLPQIISDAVMLESRRSGAFSKYAVCRIYG